MRKSLLFTFLVLMGAAARWADADPKSCQYHNAKMDFRTETITEQDELHLCVDDITLVGTLKGTYGFCVSFDTYVSSDTIFGDGWQQIETAKYESWIVTKKGTLELREWSWWDGDFGVETGFAKIIGGTGVFEGATGSLLWYPRMPDRSNFPLPFEGYICTP